MLQIFENVCDEGGVMELLNYAVKGVNIIPTTLLILVILYWVTVIMGILDFDFMDFDIDVSLDDAGAFHALLVFLNIGDIPFMVVFSILILNNWILSMLVINMNTQVSIVISVAILIISLVLTRFETMPLKGLLGNNYNQESNDEMIMFMDCVLTCDISDGRLGQAKLKTDNGEIVINVRMDDNKSISKNDMASVIGKDASSGVYYIIKI